MVPQRACCFGILLLGLLTSYGLGQETKPTATQQDLQRLQGEWKFEWMEMDGERRPTEFKTQADSKLVVVQLSRVKN